MRLALTRTTITEVPSQVALGAAEWEPVQPGAEVVDFLRRWQERSRALLGSIEHGKGVSLQQRKAAEETRRRRTVAGRRGTAGRGGARTAPALPLSQVGLVPLHVRQGTGLNYGGWLKLREKVGEIV